ncbi:MAG: hypothetical protein JWM87_3772 [Candidatus Eremiobacteraeota bacterium]|nr:hypothetical protein [Candidatus Eremiobacteraeota bacterium]
MCGGIFHNKIRGTVFQIRVLKSAMLALAFAATVPAAVAIVQLPAAAVNVEPVESVDGYRCRDCSSHEVCSNGVCSTVTTCGAWYNC